MSGPRVSILAHLEDCVVLGVLDVLALRAQVLGPAAHAALRPPLGGPGFFRSGSEDAGAQLETLASAAAHAVVRVEPASDPRGRHESTAIGTSVSAGFRVCHARQRPGAAA